MTFQRSTAVLLFGFALAGFADLWRYANAWVLLMAFAWLPGRVFNSGLAEGRRRDRGSSVERDSEKAASEKILADGPGRIALDFVVSLALLCPAILPLFLLGHSLDASRWTLGLLYSVIAVGGLSLRRSTGAARTDPRIWGAAVLAIACLLPLVHEYAGGTIDDWWDGAFIESYRRADRLSFAEPVLGSGRTHPRFVWNVWFVLQALVSRFSDTRGMDIIVDGPLPLFVAILSVCAMDLLASVVFGPRNWRLRAWSVVMVPVWLFGTEALPFFRRLHQDKFIAALVCLPVFLASVAAYLRFAGSTGLVFASLAAVALVSTHSVVFAVGLVGAVAIMMALRAEGSANRRLPWVSLTVVLAAVFVFPVVQVFWLGEWFSTSGISLAMPDNPVVRAHLSLGRLWFADSVFRVVAPSAVFGPPMVLAWFALVWTRSDRGSATRLLRWLTLLPCVLIFVPLVAAVVGRFTVPWMLYRVGWLVPVPLLLALFVAESFRRFGRWPTAAVAALVLFLVAAASMPIGVDRVRRGMYEHPYEREQYPRGNTLAMLRFLERQQEPGPVFSPPGLANVVPALTGRAVAALSERGTLVFSGDSTGAYLRLRDNAEFYAASTTAEQRRTIVARRGARFVIFRRVYITEGADSRWADKAGPSGFALAFARFGSRTWAANRRDLVEALPESWNVVYENPDFFVVRTSKVSSASLSAKRGSDWISAFDGLTPGERKRASSDEVLARAVGYPGADVRFDPFPLAAGATDRLLWSVGALLWEDAPSEARVELRLGVACEVRGIEVIPHIRNRRRDIYEVSVDGEVIRGVGADRRPIRLELEPTTRDRVEIHVRSLLGHPLSLRDLRVLGNRESCHGGWKPRLRATEADERVSIEEYMEIAGAYSLQAQASLGLARRRDDSEATRDAESVLTHALSRDVRAVGPRIERGLLLNVAGEAGTRRESRALEDFRMALRMNSNGAWGHGCMAWSRYRLRQPLRALWHGLEAVRNDPEYSDGYTILANMAARFGLPDLASRLLDRAVSIEPERNWPHMARARQLAAGGDNEEAIKTLERFLAVVPDDEPAAELLRSLR